MYKYLLISTSGNVNMRIFSDDTPVLQLYEKLILHQAHCLENCNLLDLFDDSVYVKCSSLKKTLWFPWFWKLHKVRGLVLGTKDLLLCLFAGFIYKYCCCFHIFLNCENCCYFPIFKYTTNTFIIIIVLMIIKYSVN